MTRTQALRGTAQTYLPNCVPDSSVSFPLPPSCFNLRSVERLANTKLVSLGGFPASLRFFVVTESNRSFHAGLPRSGQYFVMGRYFVFGVFVFH